MDAFQKITEERKPRQLLIDRGKEPMPRWLLQEDIRLFNTDNYKIKAAAVEWYNYVIVTPLF